MFLPVGSKMVNCTKQMYMKCPGRLSLMSTISFLTLLQGLVFCLPACKAKSSNSASSADGSETETPAAAATVNLLGSYVGSFGDNKITVLITKATADSIEGRSVVGGNDRPFSGIVKTTKGQYHIIAKEPGGDAHDGTFDFTMDAKNPDMVTGTWEPFTPTAKITGKAYSLTRKAFQYRKDAGIYPEASQRLLTEDDVVNVHKETLELMRNEIFARHGYCFKKKHLRQEFEDKDWYVPNTAEVKNMLTDIERKNISLIKKFEKYAEEYGDEFGR